MSNAVCGTILGKQILCSVDAQPSWFKHIGGIYKALQYDSQEDALSLVSLSTPIECRKDQVLVRVAYAGIDKDDLKRLSVSTNLFSDLN